MIRTLACLLVTAAAYASTPALAQTNTAGNASCPRGETPLRITGLCPSAAAEAFLSKPKSKAYREKGCRWVVNETAIGADVLLYLAQRCGNQTAALAFSGTAKAPLLTSRSAVFGEDVKLQGFPVDPSDSMRTINRVARAAIQDPTRARQCAAREDKDGQHILVDVSPQVARKLVPDGPTGGLCSDFGFSDDASHWRVFGGMAWYFRMGQDLWQSIDADNVILLQRKGSGSNMNGWSVKY